MKKFKSFFAFMLLTAFSVVVFTSCGDEPIEVEVEVSVSTTELVLSPERGASGTISITTDCSWVINNVPSFVTVSQQQGVGNSTIKVTTNAANTTASDYQDQLVISPIGPDGNSGEAKTVTIIQKTSVASDCFVEPANILLMSEGLAFNWHYGNNTKYYYWGAFSLYSFNKMSEEEVINSVDTGDRSDRVTPDQDNYACFYNLDPNSQYMIVTVPYASDGTRGQVIITPLTTKSGNNQPMAEVTAVNYYTDSNNNYYYGWTVSPNNYCSQYYTYAAASKNDFFTYNCADALLAWAIREEIKNNGEDHATRINELTDGREYFYAPKVNGSEPSYMEANIYTDMYFQVVTWGTDTKGELSGYMDIFNAYLGEDEEETASQKAIKESARIPLTNQPKTINAKRSDLNLIRIK